MKRIQLKEARQKLKNHKFQSLYSQIPFLADKSYPERTWWIRYHKLRHAWKTHFNNLHFYPDELIDQILNDKHTFEYRKGTTQYDPENPLERVNPLPWDKPNYKHGYLGHNHQLNADLDDIECLFKRLDYDWVHVRLEDISWPGVVECDYTDAEGCNDCKYRFKCELKRGD